MSTSAGACADTDKHVHANPVKTQQNAQTQAIEDDKMHTRARGRRVKTTGHTRGHGRRVKAMMHAGGHAGAWIAKRVSGAWTAKHVQGAWIAKRVSGAWMAKHV